MAIDRESVLDNYLRGNGELFCWPFQVNWPDVYTSLDEVPDSVRETFQYDPEKARELLAEAGYPNGFKTNIVTQSALVDRVEILVSYWKAIGVDVEIQPYEYASYWAVVLGKKHEGLSACTAGVADPYAVLALFRTDSFYNTIQLNDPAFDEALAETLQSPDVEQRNLSYKEMAMSFMDQAYLFAFPTEYVYSFWQPWVNNYHGEVALPMYNNGAVAARVWVDMDLKQSMIGGR